jgi:hypothetical protein
MIHLLMVQGDTSEFPEAESARIEGEQLVLRDKYGDLVHSVKASFVSAFGSRGAYFKDFSHPPVTNN